MDELKKCRKFNRIERIEVNKWLAKKEFSWLQKLYYQKIFGVKSSFSKNLKESIKQSKRYVNWN